MAEVRFIVPSFDVEVDFPNRYAHQATRAGWYRALAGVGQTFTRKTKTKAIVASWRSDWIAALPTSTTAAVTTGASALPTGGGGAMVYTVAGHGGVRVDFWLDEQDWIFVGDSASVNQELQYLGPVRPLEQSAITTP